MSEHDALLAAILADPAADLPRLVYADFIEQYQHHTTRADFIRMQVEKPDQIMVAPCLYNTAATVAWQRGFIAEVSAPLDVLMGGECCTSWLRSYSAYSSELNPHGCHKCRDTGRTPGIIPRLVREQPIEFVKATNREPRTLGDGQLVWFWTGLYPSGRDNTDHWCLPYDLWLLLSDYNVRDYRRSGMKLYPTREAAEKALSDALLELAKRQQREETPAC